MINIFMKIQEILDKSSGSKRALNAIPTPDPKKQKLPKKVLDKLVVDELTKK